LGFSFILGLSIPEWISEHPDKINTGIVISFRLSVIVL